MNGLIIIVYILAVIGVTIFALLLLRRFVRAHERVAEALESIARKKDGSGT